MEDNALREESLNKKIIDLEEKQTKFGHERQKYKDNADRKSQLIQRMKEENQRLQNKIREIVGNPVLREMPI